jgi:CPA1 family monovalent cation:H+ antiporter
MPWSRTDAPRGDTGGVFGLQVVVTVLTAVLVLTLLARRLRLVEPVGLLLGGVLLGLVPALGDVRLPPDVVLLLFLPALLYWESLNTSLREIRANLRTIVLLSVGLTLATAAAVAAVGHALGLSWPVAFVLGAVLAPTDATAVAAVARGLPRRALTTLRAESLINDGTALVIFAVAVEAATGEHGAGFGHAAQRFLLSYAGGALIGFLMAVVVIQIRRRLNDVLVENGLSVLTPFAAYLPAELAEVSGVVAVVVCGLILSQAAPRLVRAETRLQNAAFWRLSTFLLNGALFVLVGIQVPDAIGSLTSVALGAAVRDALIVTCVVIGTRLVYLNTTPYLVRALDRRAAQRARRVGFRQRLPIGWAGVRGGISLAAALAVPQVTVDGNPFPVRDEIVFITSVVILATMLLQGQTLPAVTRFARLPPDDAMLEEERMAREHITRAALAALPAHGRRLGVPPPVQRRLEEEMSTHLHDLDTTVADERTHRYEHLETALRRELLGAKRAALVRLRDARRIDDIVLRRVQEMLDTEEVRLRNRADPWRHRDDAPDGSAAGPEPP